VKVAVAGGLTTLCGGQTRRGFSQPSLFFNRNKILSVCFGTSVVTQNTLSFSRITRVLSNFKEGDYSQYFRGR
jgi:hypothetical protein